MTRTLRSLAAATLTALILAAAPAAHAIDLGRGIAHKSPDNGYDDAFFIECSDGTRFYVAEGYETGNSCDLDRVYVKTGQEIWCWYIRAGGLVSFEKTWDAKGWHDVWAGFNQVCVSQAD